MDECQEQKGRLKDLCYGVGFNGRPNPSQKASDDYRRSIGLDPIVVNSPSVRYVKGKPSPVAVSKIGTNLAKIFHDNVGQVPCGDCKAEIERLNTMTVTEVEADTEAIIGRIVSNAKRNAAWWLRLSVKTLEVVHSEIHSEYIKKCLTEACQMESINGTK